LIAAAAICDSFQDQRRGARRNFSETAANILEKKPDNMSRWREVIDNLLEDLETETPDATRFRVNIDIKIWEAEK